MDTSPAADQTQDALKRAREKVAPGARPWRELLAEIEREFEQEIGREG